MNSTAATVPGRTTLVLGPTLAERSLYGLGLPLVGLGLGLALVRVAPWVERHHWMPLPGPLPAIFGFMSDVAWAHWAVIFGLALIGLLIAGWLDEQMTRVRVENGVLTFTAEQETTEIAVGDISAVFTERKQLVVVDRSGVERLRRSSDISPARLRAALPDLPWCDFDPHSGEFTRWTQGGAGLPGGAEVLLVRRQGASKAEQKRQLRAELSALGVSTKDVGGRQWVRVSSLD